MTQTDVHDTAVTDLRSWAKGIYPTEAAIQLLVSAFGGRFARPGWPWIGRTESGHFYIDAAKLNDDEIGMLSGGERRVLHIARSLLGEQPVDLADTLTGLDRPTTRIVMNALEHATGSHEQATDPAAFIARLRQARNTPRHAQLRARGPDIEC